MLHIQIRGYLKGDTYDRKISDDFNSEDKHPIKYLNASVVEISHNSGFARYNKDDFAYLSVFVFEN
jgi:hypothetical protein